MGIVFVSTPPWKESHSKSFLKPRLLFTSAGNTISPSVGHTRQCTRVREDVSSFSPTPTFTLPCTNFLALRSVFFSYLLSLDIIFMPVLLLSSLLVLSLFRFSRSSCISCPISINHFVVSFSCVILICVLLVLIG